MSNLKDHEAEQDAITARYEAAAQTPNTAYLKGLSKKELRAIIVHERYHAIMRAATARHEDRIYRALWLLNAIQDDADIGMETDEIVKQAIKELTK